MVQLLNYFHMGQHFWIKIHDSFRIKDDLHEKIKIFIKNQGPKVQKWIFCHEQHQKCPNFIFFGWFYLIRTLANEKRALSKIQRCCTNSTMYSLPLLYTKNLDETIYNSWDIEREILKNSKSTWIYYHFTHAYHKWQSYDVWFLSYGA